MLNLQVFWAWFRRHAPSVWRRARWLLLRAVALLGACLLLMLFMTGAAGWYTSRSEFCNSCHIMEPYYKSWQESTHKNVPCIDCHFAPGFGSKIRGKLLGLVQLAKYVTRSEGPRPSAEVPDASCLRSGCHETRLLSGRVDYRGVHFDHTPHLQGLRRGKQLRCTSCHSQIVQGKHMAVTATTCFLCHFKDQPFNEGLAACTRCHQIPEKEYDLGGGVKFTHELAFKKGVNCANCHGDLIRGKGEVPKEHCLSCHNREDDLKRINDHEFMHQTHVADHKIDCLQCHLQIEHSLDKDKLVHAAGDCKSCHPDHHREQIEMLSGIGAKSIATRPNAMLTTRADCHTCHRTKVVSETGTVLWKGSEQACLMCHLPSEVDKLRAYHEALRAVLPELESGIQSATKALPDAQLPADRAAAIAQDLERLQSDLAFVRKANDIHNIHYASTLIRALVAQLSEICRTLKVPEPKIQLPPAAVQMSETAVPMKSEPKPER